MMTDVNLPSGKKRIHINQHVIKRNNKVVSGGPREPPIIVRHKSGTTYARGVTIYGASKVVYSPDKPLSCGAKVWIETDSQVTLDVSEE